MGDASLPRPIRKSQSEWGSSDRGASGDLSLELCALRSSTDAPVYTAYLLLEKYGS